MRHGLMRYMRAHGQTPGPGERPKMAGALAGAGAGILAWPILHWFGADRSLSMVLQSPEWLIVVLYVLVASFAGALYGGFFQRAASDPRGGWLFGISYGFLFWMLGPVGLVQTLLDRPLATGRAAMGLLAASLLSGLVLGLLFRQVHALVRKGLRARAGEPAREAAFDQPPAQKVAVPRTTPESR